MRLPGINLPRFAPVLIGIALTLWTRDGQAQRDRSRFGRDNRSRVDTTVAFDKNGTVTVSAMDGDIIITGWSRDQVQVHAVSEDDDIRFDASSSRLNLELNGSSHGSDARFEVSVPYGVHVNARTRSGDMSVRGTRGEVEARAQSGDIVVEDVTSRLDVSTLSGDVTASNVSGDVEIGSTSGEVKITDVRGDVEVSTVSGDVGLRGVTAKNVRAKTTSGDVTFDGAIDPAGRYELGAHSGDVRLHVQRDASAQLTVATWNGGISSDFPITLKPGEHGIGTASTKRFTFSIGGGAARITAETFSGDITISANGRGASVRP